MLAILCLEHVLNDSLDHKNPKNAWEWRNSAQNKGTLASAKRHAYVEVTPCVCGGKPTYAALTLHTQG